VQAPVKPVAEHAISFDVERLLAVWLRLSEPLTANSFELLTELLCAR
jgi:hypothetical protein